MSKVNNQTVINPVKFSLITLDAPKIAFIATRIAKPIKIHDPLTITSDVMLSSYFSIRRIFPENRR